MYSTSRPGSSRSWFITPWAIASSRSRTTSPLVSDPSFPCQTVANHLKTRLVGRGCECRRLFFLLQQSQGLDITLAIDCCPRYFGYEARMFKQANNCDSRYSMSRLKPEAGYWCSLPGWSNYSQRTPAFIVPTLIVSTRIPLGVCSFEPLPCGSCRVRKEYFDQGQGE
jgi:hypothetical protein